MSKFNRMLYILNKLELGAKVKPEEIAKEFVALSLFLEVKLWIGDKELCR